MSTTEGAPPNIRPGRARNQNDTATVDFIERLLACRYVVGGDNPLEGLDCYGLVRTIQSGLFGLALPPIHPDDRDPNAMVGNLARRAEAKQWQDVDYPKAGDIVIMGNVDGRQFHMGVVVFMNSVCCVVHTDSNSGVVVDDIVALPVKGFNQIRYKRHISKC